MNAVDINGMNLMLFACQMLSNEAKVPITEAVITMLLNEFEADLSIVDQQARSSLMYVAIG